LGEIDHKKRDPASLGDLAQSFALGHAVIGLLADGQIKSVIGT
jgi:hypothetical protein